MATQFDELCIAFKGIGDYLSDEHPPFVSPTGWPPSGERMAALIEGSAEKLPPRYRTDFFRKLFANTPDVARKLNAAYRARILGGWSSTAARFYVQLRADSLVGAATAWSDPDSLPAVQRFEAVVNDLFESFVTKSGPVVPGLHLNQRLPPLVTFAPAPSMGPATLVADEVAELCGAELSIVSLPKRYEATPMLWGILAHETSGHAVTHALQGLADELRDIVGKIKFQRCLSAGLWQTWIEEAAADVYGVLNVGPSFVIGLAAWLRMSKAPNPFLSKSIALIDGQPDNEHPPDLLRLYVLRGAVGALNRLSDCYKSAWMQDIDAMIAQAVEGIDFIAVERGDPLQPQKIPLTMLAADAELLGKSLVEVQPDALSDGKPHTIQDIETWSDCDEKSALAVKAKALDPDQPLDVKGADPARLIAGATMALCTNAKLYDSLNCRLGAALQDRYAGIRVLQLQPSTSRAH
jgi:hypothetical protein